MHPSTLRSEAPATPAGGVFALAYGLLAYLLFFASFGVYWVAFLADRWVSITVNHRPGDGLPVGAAVAVDLGLVLLFGLQHSVMARPAFKRRWTRIVPPALERSTYVLLSSLLLGLLMLCWQPLPEVVWRVDAPVGQGLLWSLFALGLPLCVVASFQIDHFDLFGLRQAWARFRGRPYAPPEFVEPWLYRVVRHPIQLGVLLLLWPLPTMTAGHLLLAASMTLYMLIGLYFEERDLVASFGESYRTYRRRVPGLVPGLAAVTRRVGWGEGGRGRSTWKRARKGAHKGVGTAAGKVGGLGFILLALLPAVAAGAPPAPPVPVSPGSPEEVVTIAPACPTFSWTASPEAVAVELAVYRLDPEAEAVPPEEAPPVLEQRLPAGASSWSPPAARCLDPGGRYAWFVRAEVDAGLAPWSEGHLFEVAGWAVSASETPRGGADESVEGPEGPAASAASSRPAAQEGTGRPAPPSAPTAHRGEVRFLDPDTPEEGTVETRMDAAATTTSFRTSGHIVTDGNYRFGSPKVVDFLVPAASFRPRSNFEDTEWTLGQGFGFVASMPTGDGRVGLVAPLQLPAGSTVLSFECWVWDSVELDPDDTDDIDDLALEMSLVSRPRGSTVETTMASVSTVTEGGAPGFSIVSDRDVAFPTVSPNRIEYRLEGIYTAESPGSSLRFYGCQLRLEIDRLGPL